MVNIGLIVIAGVAIVLTVILIIALVWAGISSANYHTNTGGTGTTGTNTTPPCIQNINISSLLQIPSGGMNCIQNGITGSLYYIGHLGNEDFDYVVAPWSTQPLDVCIGFCTKYSNGSCTGPLCNGQSAQANFDRCMKQLNSSTCLPPIPLAAKGTTIYYAYSPTCNICDGCGYKSNTLVS